MKAIIQRNFEGIAALQIGDVKQPPVTPITALIKTAFTPVIPYDWMTEEGRLKDLRPVHLPMVIGYGFSGVVTAVGALRSPALVGKRVIGLSQNGTSQEYNANHIPPLLIEVPDQVSLEAAATVIGGADTAQAVIDEARLAPGSIVLITGASGGVGTALIQLLRRQEVTVVAMASTENTEFVREVGATIVLDYEQFIAPQLQGLPPIDLIIDTVGSAALLTELSAGLDYPAILSLSLPSYQPHLGQLFRFLSRPIMPSAYRNLLHLMATGELKAYVDRVLPFEEVVQAQLLAKTAHSRGRTLLSYE
ncbi:NADP-dependent oxidoreductase [Lacticaseibacillus mingshuiensis]|uniref:NADP-dependent oxidoreductase n=1 Tax=Lacticaseibacillus mingshuiensis TaxID=2799574 RepID=A0ABW4CGX9_9LACO|nr:NADP-dependent oxidoreductase [Lacticaseibacillus mingshuiensis]